MKRSEQNAASKMRSKDAYAGPDIEVASGLFLPPSRDSSRAVFAPLHYEPKYAYPLIVWLHGAGCDEWQLIRIMPMLSMRNYLAVAPRGLRIKVAGPLGDVWGWPQQPADVAEAEQRIFESLAAARRKYHVAPRRVFLAGCGDGGTMAYRVAMSHPQHFAGILAMGGSLPRGNTPFANWTSIRQIPLFLAVCRESQTYPSQQACEDLRLLHSAGMQVTLRQYPGDQPVGPRVLHDANGWIMEWVTGTADSAHDSSADDCRRLPRR
jgi:phospholipase/carboxylesterase